MIREQWQADIVVRDLLATRTLFSAVANRLYPELAHARDRERKLLEIPEMKRLARLCNAEVEALTAELAAWDRAAA